MTCMVARESVPFAKEEGIHMGPSSGMIQSLGQNVCRVLLALNEVEM